MKQIIFLIIFSIHHNALALSLQLFSEITGETLKNTEVTVIRHNSIQCVTDPCPSNEYKVNFNTNSNGKITITNKNLLMDKDYLILKVKKYNPIRFTKLKGSEVYLRADYINSDYRVMKLIDRYTKSPIKNKEVIFSGKGIKKKDKSNFLGIVYYKYKEIFPKGLAQTDPVIIKIKGYKAYKRYQHHRGEAELIPEEF